MPRFDQSFSGLCEQNLQDTLQLKQRYLDAKNKRQPKTKDKKQQDSIQSSVHVQQKFLKRAAEEHEAGGNNDGFEPPVKLQCTTQHGSHQPEGLTKFSVEIVQQLEFTTSAANSQPQQISTNVTVKAHTNASVKSDVSSPKSNPSTPASNLKQNSGGGGGGIGCVDVGTLVECVKQEPDNDFADLDQCAAALEKDAAANGGAGFGGFSDLIGEDTNDEIITSDAFKDLISDISNYPEFMKDFDFEDKTDNSNVVNGLKVEELKELPQNVIDNAKSTQSPLLQNQNNYSPPVFDAQGMGKNRMSYSNMDFAKTELSPAAQTLKQMAEQHQHKNQMGLSFNPNNRTPNSRSPYPDFQFQGDYGSPNSNPNFHKNSPNFPQPDMIKQEMIFQGNDFDMKRKGAGMYKGQYSPYGGSPSTSSHGSPGYLPRGNTGSNTGTNSGAFGGGTPPRPPSGPGGNNNTGTSLQINQAQQLHINQQAHGHNIQVSAGQHLHLSGDLKGNVSIATQQGLHFNHGSSNHTSQPATSQSSNQQGSGISSQASTAHPGNINNLNQQSQGPNQHSNNMMGNQQHPNHNLPPHQGPNGNMSGLMSSTNMGNNMHGGLPGNINSQSQLNDSYSLSQSQTINFTQQTLRQRNGAQGGVPNQMGPTGPLGPGPMSGQRHMTPQAMEQQKLLQQQQMLRAQQAAMQQHMVRPPPPDYKTSAGMMQGMQPRYSGQPPNIRRMPHQPMPPSGPMIRPHSNMYMMQQQHMAASRTMYQRQQAPMGGMDSMPQHGNAEWRHILMTQQQNANFNSQMRPNFHGQGFNINSGSMQMTALQHQQIRSQQAMVSGGMGPNGQQNLNQGMGQGQMLSQNGPMSQMNNMNQQMMSHMQQQQQNAMQQNTQMSMTNIHMHQSQSLTVSNQAVHQQQQSNMNNQLSGTTNTQTNSLSSFNPQTSDFGLEFLENLPTTDTNAFTDQELLNSFDSGGFNLDF